MEVVLKDVRPDYKDPETFFERMEEAEKANPNNKKDTKKAPKK